jgi:hypothetical protein
MLIVFLLRVVGNVFNFAPMIDDVVAAADVNQQSSADFTIVVTYDDDNRLDTNTFDDQDIVITG